MLDRQIQYFDNPFRYAIIDNFFSKEDLEFVSENIDKVEQDKNFKDMNKLNFVVQNQLKRRLKKDIHNFKTDPVERFAKYFEFIDSLDIKNDPEKDYTSDYAYFFRSKNKMEHFPVHTEDIYKGISIVVYMSEEPNCGTELYNENLELVKEVEWKYNRAFVMSGFNNQKGLLPGKSTWHAFKVKPNSYRRTFFGYTITSEQSILNHSLYENNIKKLK
tara:strand:+ start:171 stop:821 length:651 start_codon:yes stop_codon:yes gene_type:complete